MRLLVSVRSASEVEPALAGGADIIDAKEPGRGALGSVSLQTLEEILRRVPPDRPLSVALGDVARSSEPVETIASLALPVRPAPVYLKIGFAGARSSAMVSRVLENAVATAAEHSASTLIVAVAYADADRAASLAPELILHLAHRAHAAGVLLDTHTKDGTGLLGWLSQGALAGWVARARGAGLLTALAGSLRLEDLEAVCRVQPDVIGVRGAACEGGREGRVSASRVGALQQRLRGCCRFPEQIFREARRGPRNAGRRGESCPREEP